MWWGASSCPCCECLTHTALSNDNYFTDFNQIFALIINKECAEKKCSQNVCGDPMSWKNISETWKCYKIYANILKYLFELVFSGENAVVNCIVNNQMLYIKWHNLVFPLECKLCENQQTWDSVHWFFIGVEDDNYKSTHLLFSLGKV